MFAERLGELLDDLERCRADDEARVASYRTTLQEARRRLQDVPLVRGITQRQHFQRALHRGLEPRKLILGDTSFSEDYLGIDGVVYMSAGILYPEKEFAIVLSSRIDDEFPVEATPWETGALCRSLCPDIPQPPSPERREIFLKYRLRAPYWREYLVHYVASCYQSPVDYLTLQSHKYRDPLGALGGRWTSRCFEARIAACITLQPTTIAAIFSRRDKGGIEFLPVRVRLGELEDRGVAVHYYSGGWERLRNLVQQWMCSRNS